MATVTITSPFGDLKECLSLVNSGTTDLAYNFGNILKISDEYTFSCWFKANKNTKIKVQIGNNISDYFTVTTAWNKIVYTAKADISKSKIVLFSVPAGVTLYAFEGMLERGNMPSDFKKNEEDLENTVTTLQTDFKVEQGKITSLIKETETIKSTYTTKDEFNNLQIGGRNLLKNSSMVGEQLKCDSRQGCNSSTTLAYATEGFHIVTPSEGNMNNGIVFIYDDFTKLGINVGDTITFSLLVKGSSDSNQPFINIIFQNDGTTWYGNNILTAYSGYFTPTDTFKKVYVTYTLPTDKKYTSKRMFIGIHGNMKSDLYIKNLKLELGNKATDWTPAPEDLETKVTTLTDKYNETVQTVEGNKTTIASIKTTVDDNTKNIKSMDSRMTTVETTADGLKTSVSKVQSDVDNLQIGGRNLLRQSGHWTEKPIWWVSNGGGLELDTSVKYLGHNTIKTTVGSGIVGNQNKFFELDTNKIYTYSAMIKMTGDAYSGSNTPLHYHCSTDGSNNNSGIDIIKYDQSLTNNNWKLLYLTFKPKAKYFRPFVYIGSGSRVFNIAYLKLELGNRPTDWTPAPEDVDNSIQTLSEQTASKFSWIVKSGSSSSDFTLTDRTAQLVADNINLKGLVKFSGLNSDAQTKINNAQNTADTANGKIDNLNIGGRNLVVGTSNANVNSSWKGNGWTGSFLKYESENRTYKLIANNGWYMRQYTALTDYIGKKVTVSFKAKNISEETTATENYALGFTNPANGGSEYFTSFLTEGKPKQDEWIDIQYTVTLNTKGSFGIGCMCTPEGKSLKTTWLIKDLKIEKGNKATDWTPAPEDKANQSVIDNWAKDSIVAGETSINGGYIKTNTIETDQLAVDKIFATGSAVMNIINAQEINANRITSGLLSANRLDVYGLNVLNKETNQQTFSVSNNGEVSMRGSVSSYDYHEGKTGWTINKDGTAEFNDIIARGSVITNDGGIVSSGGTGENLQKNSSFYDGLNNWTYGSSFSADSSTQYNGTNSAKFSRTGLTADAPNYLYSGKTNIACKAGQTFTAQANFYTEDVSSVDSKGANFGIWFYTSDGAGCGDSYNIKKSLELTKDSWTHMEVTATAPDNAAYVALVVGVYRNGAFWVSQPKLEEGDIATPWSLSPDDKIKQVRFWAGATYDERESAPFIVYNDGTIKATQGEFSGVFSGTVDIGNITIQDPSSAAGGDAIVTIRNGQTGVNTVQLTDLKESKFAQNLVVTNNTYSNMIELRQDGTGLFNDGISVADTVVLNSSGVNINKALISVNPETKAFTMNGDLNVGTSNLGANLIVHGDASAENIRVSNVLYFGSVVKFTTTTNGINIDYIGG